MKMKNIEKNTFLKPNSLKIFMMSTSSVLFLSVATIPKISAMDSDPEEVTQRFHIKQIMDEQYEKVEIINTSRVPDAYQYITHHLPLNVFPVLPTSNRWTKQGQEYVAMKHKDAPLHRLEFGVFSDNLESPSKVNYITLIDNVNVQSFFYTRPKGKTFKGKRDSYAFTVAEPRSLLSSSIHNTRSQVYLKPYVDGHCGDHADTPYPEVLNWTHSSADPRNHIPEPPNSYWGLHVRNHLVADIREQEGCYMQSPYYSIHSPKTNLGPLVPEGVYFTRFNHFITPQETYHIPWDDPIHNPKRTQFWSTLLEPKKVDERSHGYLPYIVNLTGSDQQWWQQSLDSLLSHSPIVNGNCQIYDVRLAENLKMAADWEIENITFKMRYLHFSHLTNLGGSADTSYWHDRALHHADLLLEFGKSPFPLSHLEEARFLMKQTNEEQYDYWRQVITATQEEFSTNESVVHTFSPERKRYNPPSSMKQFGVNDLVNTQSFYEINFGKGKASITQIKNAPPLSPQDMRRIRKIWLKEADVRTTKSWLKTNEKVLERADKSQIEIYYKPRTQKKSWENIENLLESAQFEHIFRKWE